MSARTSYAVFASVLVGTARVPVRVTATRAPGRGIEFTGVPDVMQREHRARIQSSVIHLGGLEGLLETTQVRVAVEPAAQGTELDLAMALAILGVLGALGEDLPDETPARAFLGTLSYKGNLSSPRGVLTHLVGAPAAGVETVVVPCDVAADAVPPGVQPIAVSDLKEAVGLMRGHALRLRALSPGRVEAQRRLDLRDIRGHAAAKRALMVAAAGQHHLLLVGPPGAAQTLLARALLGILPPMTPDEALEASMLHSLAGLLPVDAPMLSTRPFRAPHYTVNGRGLVGAFELGKGAMRPGELSLAHHGVFALADAPEFSREALDTLREPLDSGKVTIYGTGRTELAAHFQLVATMGPCPCGWYGSTLPPCTCAPERVTRYNQRFPLGLRDLIDVTCEVPNVVVPATLEREADPGLTSDEALARVMEARLVLEAGEVAHIRKGTRDHGVPATKRFTHGALQALSQWDHDRTVVASRKASRIAATLAALDGTTTINEAHVLGATAYVPLDP